MNKKLKEKVYKYCRQTSCWACPFSEETCFDNCVFDSRKYDRVEYCKYEDFEKSFKYDKKD